jgi:hypothetical protein
MKKLFTVLSIALALNITTAIAQTKTAPKVATKAPAKSKISKTDSLLCGKDWRVVSVIAYGVETRPPGEENKNDVLKLNLDGTYTMVLFGASKTGTWSKAGQSIIFKEGTGQINFKVITQEPNLLKVDHYDPERFHTLFVYEPK